MEGPAGVSIAHDMAIPKRTLRIPKVVEEMAIFSGERLIFRAAAAGIISKAVISNIPTNFIAKAITDAIISIKVVRIAITFIPST